MGRITVIAIGALFALMAGVLGVVATLLVVVLAKEYFQEQPLAPISASSRFSQPDALGSRSPSSVVESEPARMLSRSGPLEVQPAAYSAASVQLLPAVVASEPAVSAEILLKGLDPNAPALEPVIRCSVKAKVGLSFSVKAKLDSATPGIPPADENLAAQTVVTVAPATPVGANPPDDRGESAEIRFLPKRPGTYTLTATCDDKSIVIKDGKVTVSPVPVTGLNIEFEELTYKLTGGADEFVVPKAGLQEPVVLPVDRFQFKLKAISGLPRRLALRSQTQADGVREMGNNTFSTPGAAQGVFPDGSTESPIILSDGTHQLYAHDIWSDQRLPGTISVSVRDQRLVPPQVLEISNNSRAKLQAITTSPAVNVYNRFVALRGAGLNLAQSPLRNIAFPVYVKSEKEKTRFIYAGTVRPQFVSEPNQFWSAVIKLPEFKESPLQTLAAGDNGNMRLFAVVQEDGRIAFSNAATNLHVVTALFDATKIPVPKDFAFGANAAVTPVAILRSNQTSVAIKAIADASLSADHRMVVLDAAGKVVGVGAKSTDVASEFAAKVTDLTEGLSEYRLGFSLGDQIGTLSPPIKIQIQTKGPRVTGVNPPNFGTAPGIQQITVQFSRDNLLVKENAENEHNYLLLGSSGTGAFNRGTEKRHRPLTAVFDASANAVVLNFSAVPADIYQLRINGHATGADPFFTGDIAAADGNTAGNTDGDSDKTKLAIVDVFGNALAGNDGKAETDYILEMSRAATSESESQLGLPGRMADVSGIPESKGPQIDYPEYTEPRKYPNGFNPSDKVVSRVARLYYFRDAHRVTQVINRRVQSYNRQNSSMARQLADQARNFAKGTVDERRKAERSAVQSAHQAREAENSLATLQQALVTARNDLQRAQSAMSQQNESIARQNESLRSLQAQESELASAMPPNPEELKTVREQRSKAELALAAANRELARTQEQETSAQSQITLNEQRINATLATIESLRTQEISDRESMETTQAKEDRAIEQQFRLEVAAAKEDPDTYAPGIPKSDDPVAQVSLSVIGEGLIQLRGPLKGVNIVRTMINEIDVPVGQVRIGVHTVQVNGDDGNKMEQVTGRIQRYIDHSRFLTAQSAQMLRNAVVLVASEKATTVEHMGLEGSQELRDLKYQEAFFGKDFMDELRQMDSEFLHTGNKVLGLHSMDSTSLASALFLLGLASNDTRQQIICVFEATLKEKLRKDERAYFAASDVRRFNGLNPPFKFMADNARFVSFRGYFDNTVVGDSTLNPVQREFIRLAQIFKSRLITEVELKQRVVERALIEERIGDYQKQLRLAVQREQMAEAKLEEQKAALRKEQVNVLQGVQQLTARAVSFADFVKTHSEIYPKIAGLEATQRVALEVRNPEIARRLNDNNLRLYHSIVGRDMPELQRGLHGAISNGDVFKAREYVIEIQKVVNNGLFDVLRLERLEDTKYGDFTFETTDNRRFTIMVNDMNDSMPVSELLNPGSPDAFVDYLRGLWSHSEELLLQLQQVRRSFDWEQDVVNLLKEIDDLRNVPKEEVVGKQDDPLKQGDPFKFYVQSISLEYRTSLKCADVRRDLDKLQSELDRVRQMLMVKSPNVTDAHIEWVKIRSALRGMIRPSSTLQSEVDSLSSRLDSAFEQILTAGMQSQFAQEQAEAARRPLDHKKFLDMLIDETEEKFIELVEGTRSHTAVIDDYVKRLATALDDDFNTQFYEPAFRNIRQQIYVQCMVDLGQIEHTTILTNNRAFAKVLPQATMEFDLPKRDIVIAEALNSAYAAYNDYGALMADPNFLALTKLFSGQPTAPIFSENSVAPMVRDVLPGLPSQTDESLLIQAPTGQPQFASQLEALIPDPAVYKFETGTGFEIRPVIQPDGQSVVFNFNYMYTTNIREPVRADEKHLGRVKRHFINTDVQIGNYELREVSRYRVALKAARTTRGVPLLEDIPLAGVLFRPLPQGESSLQQNIILAQSVIFPTLFDLMGLRWAPAVADLDACQLQEQEFVYRSRMKSLKNRVYDYSSEQVDQFLRVPEGERRRDLYRTQEEIPLVHPNGYSGPGLDRQDSPLMERAGRALIPDAPALAVPLLDGGAAPLLPVMPPAEVPFGVPPAEARFKKSFRYDGVMPASGSTSERIPDETSAPTSRLSGNSSSSRPPNLRSSVVPPPSRPLPRVAPPVEPRQPMSNVDRPIQSFAGKMVNPLNLKFPKAVADHPTVTITPAIAERTREVPEILSPNAIPVDATSTIESLRDYEATAAKSSPQRVDGEALRPQRRLLPKGWPFH